MSDKPNNEMTLKQALQAMIEHYRLRGKLNQSRIKSLWAQLMGPSIAGYTKEIRLSKNKLYITIESAPLRQELSYGREKIRKMLNEKLGGEYIEEVVIR
ncbi:MAG: DUF721 domain-containing protein [Phaeodactylibacter sp.]|nr:DUF721 domain-containing protein [Phaeodactylibacter sp.]MCO6491245.1 DUF721 domain-containing protein [Phaeodactylibacter sp.]